MRPLPAHCLSRLFSAWLWHRLFASLPFVPRLLAMSFVCLGVLWHAAQAQSTTAEAERRLDAAQKEIAAIQEQLKGNPSGLDDALLTSLRARGQAAQAAAEEVAASLAPQVASTSARIAELGTPAAGAKEDADVASQRGTLNKSLQTLDGQVKLSRLLSVEAEQTVAQVVSLRRGQFQARLGQRTNSVLSAAFWSELLADLPQDLLRAASLFRAQFQAFGAAPASAWLEAAVVLVLGHGLLWLVYRWLMSWLTQRAPAGRVRRSLYALMRIGLWMARFAAFSIGPYLVIGREASLTGAARQLLNSAMGMWVFGGFLFGLAEALLSVRRPSWRLLPISEGVAAALRWFPLQITVVTLSAWLFERVAALVNASLTVTVAVNCIVALALGLTVALAVFRAERALQGELAETAARPRPLWQSAAVGLNRLVLTVAVLSLLSGYVAFGSFAIKQLVWIAIVLAATYVLAAAIDDLLMAWVKNKPQADADASGDKAAASPSVGAGLQAQAAVLLSGMLRLGLLLFALSLLFAPFGETPAELLRSSGQWQQGIDLGEFQLRPAAALHAVLVLVLGLAAVRLLRGWLTNHYLPSTSLDAGMRVSTATLFGYAGSVAVGAMAMSAMGVGLERIAWVASALSVGIGFGLQAVVQNFVSGLILLAERPVKVGDWVSLGGIEGDIRRINVRATEIQMGDHSTVIVPNSEFITKVVRNVTLADPVGLVQVKLPMPFSSNALQVRDILLAAFAADPDVLESPEPGVLLDSVEGNQLMFIATGHVRTPRIAGKVRSALLLDVLQRLGEAGIPLSKSPTMLLKVPPEEKEANSA